MGTLNEERNEALLSAMSHLSRSLGNDQGHRRWANLSAVALVFFTTTTQAASEPEVEVIGCVQDYGGRPYRNVHVELSGLNYKGGAGYSGNNSVDTTNERGEFSVRMKAGKPAQPGIPEQPATARISGTRKVYVTSGWQGGPWGGADVWPKITVSNTGKPVDLRPKGCIRFPYPIDVSGVVTSDDLKLAPYPTLTLRINAVGDYSKITTSIPSSSGHRDFNFGVDLRLGDAYKIEPEQPQCAQCVFESPAGEKIGESELTLLPGSDNTWSANMLRLHCRRKPPQPKGDCKAVDDLTEALPRKGSSSGAEMFQQAINQAEIAAQAEQERLAREAQARRAAVAQEWAQQQQKSVVSSSGATKIKSSSKYSSTCERNVAKINRALSARGVGHSGATYDLFMRDVQLLLAKIMEPCAGSDSSAARNYQLAMDEYNKINRYCAGPHESYVCRQWGSGEVGNKNWFAGFSAEANKALSDPNYSVDLDGGIPPSILSNPPAGGCKVAYDRQEAEFEAINKRDPKSKAIVPGMQVVLYMTKERMALLDRLCKGQPQYGGYASQKQVFDTTLRTCRQIATDSGDCVPRLAW